MMNDVKLLIPDMPTTDDLIPYLRRIDCTHWYSNLGPLVLELEERLTKITGVPCVTVANGTLALEMALQAVDKCFARMPALTFSATGLAAAKLGYGVELVDVDSTCWQMTTEQALTADTETVIVPVATFGIPIPIEQWENFCAPVVMDAAGAFPAQVMSTDPNIITCFSLHATKFIGCGEGGFVASNNPEIINKIRSLSTFGENGTNAKMSEYHAAVALASLDDMPRKMGAVPWWAMRAYAAVAGKSCRILASLTMCNIELPIPASEVMPRMLAVGIETKQWYRPYLDERAEFSKYQEGRFPVTTHLRTHLLGLPFHNFLTEEDVARVCAVLKEVLK